MLQNTSGFDNVALGNEALLSHMTKITVLPHETLCPAGAEIESPAGETLCDALLRNGIAIEHACEKSCACTTCHVVVKQGLESLADAEEKEEDMLDIKAIFGETAVRRKMRLKLIVHLVRRETLERDYERLPSEPITQDVLGVPVRKVVIQVVAGRNIAVLVEAAVRNSILQLRGIDTYQEFVARQRKAMERGS